METNINKKIIFVANVDKEHICKFHIPTIKYFKSKGWIVDVACAGNTDIPECDNRFYGKWKRSPFRFGTITGTFQLRKILKKNNYDVLYCHTPVGGLVARLATIGLKKKPLVVYFAHGFHFYKGAPKKNWFTIYPIEKILSRRTDLLITLNQEDYELAKKKLSKKAKIILSPGIGVNFEKLKLEDKEEIRNKYREEFNVNDKVVLTYVAELINNKNQNMLIKTLKRICEKRDDVVLLLVGPDHAEGYYQKLVKQLDLSDKVIFTGWRSDVGALLAMSDICVASSIREGLGINLVEAMYIGLPVVATDNRGHKAVIENDINGCIVPINDDESMANVVLELIENKDLRKKLSNINVDKYDARVIAKNLYNEINVLLKEVN